MYSQESSVLGALDLVAKGGHRQAVIGWTVYVSSNELWQMVFRLAHYEAAIIHDGFQKKQKE